MSGLDRGAPQEQVNRFRHALSITRVLFDGRWIREAKGRTASWSRGPFGRIGGKPPSKTLAAEGLAGAQAGADGPRLHGLRSLVKAVRRREKGRGVAAARPGQGHIRSAGALGAATVSALYFYPVPQAMEFASSAGWLITPTG